jgi:drug/metabolite transporter (DMT)-like permease
MQTFHVSNVVGGVFFAPLWICGASIAVQDLWHPAVVAGLICLAGFSMFTAIRLGDVSLVTPLMGTKVIFVALALVGIGRVMTVGLWVASVLTPLGVFLIGYKDFRAAKAGGRAVGFALLSSVLFGFADVLLQQWAPLYGGVSFLGVMAGMIGLVSVVMASLQGWREMRLPQRAVRPVVVGSLVLAVQGMMMGFALGFFDDVGRVNIVYGIRGFWSILLVWLIGRWFGNDERAQSQSALGWRIAGTTLLTAAIVLALIG